MNSQAGGLRHKIRVTRKYNFPASHRLHSDALAEHENERIYGKCNNPYGHGHDYVLHVSARGPVDSTSGVAVHVETLDRLVEESVLQDVRYANLNDLKAFEGVIPTTENLLEHIENNLRARWKQWFPGEWPQLASIRIDETRRNTFEAEGREE